MNQLALTVNTSPHGYPNSVEILEAGAKTGLTAGVIMPRNDFEQHLETHNIAVVNWNPAPGHLL